MTEEHLLSSLVTSRTGLSSDEAAARLQRYGPNEIAAVKGTPLALRFLANFYHLFAILLWVGAALAVIGGLPELAYAIAAVIVVNAVFSFWQEYRAERATEALKELIPARAGVLRDGARVELLAREVVPGDVLLLEEGDNVPADARLIEEYDLRVNQATLNGESAPARRVATPVPAEPSAPTEVASLVFAGTSVVYGRGRAVVFATGMDTEFGRIARLTRSVEEELSPLQKQMERITRLVALLAVSLGVVFFVLGYFVAGLTLIEGFLFAVGIIVANVPEGLLPTVTLSLAMGVQRMAGRNALVKQLAAVETLGSTTVICTDKTGTLTANEMTVRQVWTAEGRVEVHGVGYEPTGPVRPSLPTLEPLARAASFCNDSRLVPPDDAHPAWRVVGDPTEGALLVMARKAGFDPDAALESAPRASELPFDAVRKRMSTVHAEDGRRIAYVKGAPAEVLGLCSRVLTDSGERPLDERARAEALAANDEMARGGLRVLAMARREVPDRRRYEAAEVERDLTFLGLAGMMDPPRAEVAETVRRAHSAGIRIIMITGDYGLTAESIARRIGIVTSERLRIVIGSELASMPEEELVAALRAGEVLFARVAPEHKMRIAQALKKMGHVVAMTGDGVNDAPALKAADIGIAMGVAGTDVAREAAKMVLADDNFASIVYAVEEGRAVYDNIRRFVTYIFTSNVPEIVPFILFVLFRIPLPLTVLQILAIDLGTDIVPALALGVEAPEPGVMERPPRPARERLLDSRVLSRAYFFLGPLQTAATMVAYFYLYYSRGWRPGEALAASGVVYLSATTMTLAAVVSTQIGNAFAQRTTRRSIVEVGFFSNRLLLAGIATEVALILGIVYLPPLQAVFRTAPLRATDWLVPAALWPTLLLADELRKAVLRRGPRPHSSAGRATMSGNDMSAGQPPSEEAKAT
ncbi:MAG: cation-transporting P-type ATPase [Coriobacteriia bacterium]|nr:cation-transporting P-type ATPase [Coriobacteriia bacterium]